MNTFTNHHHVCSTYSSRTKPTAQGKAAIRAANAAIFSKPTSGNHFSTVDYNQHL